MPPRKKPAAAAPTAPATSDAPQDTSETPQLPAAEVAEQSAGSVEISSADVVDNDASHQGDQEEVLDVAAADAAQSGEATEGGEHSSDVASASDADMHGVGGSAQCAGGPEFNLVFLGTGVSTTIPKLSHFLAGSCAVCNDAAARPFSKNRRNNVNALISVPISPDDTTAVAAPATDGGSDSDKFWNASSSSSAKTSRYICIDFSPTIRDSAMRFFPASGCRTLDAVTLPSSPQSLLLIS